MSGIYIHVPFCKTRCIYCDFFSTTSSEYGAYVDALLREIELNKDYLEGDVIDTIYFGGGTPSQLSFDYLNKIVSSLYQCFKINSEAEITFEANPDDLTADYVAQLTQLPVNRLSIGIQTFEDEELRFLKRRHSAQQAMDIVRSCQAAGFSNISIDLMYGLPDQTLETFEKNIETALSLDVPHISAYHLIYEKGTKMSQMLAKKMIRPVEEDTSVEMFALLIRKLKESGFEHYEISNFARGGLYSRHNSSYWTGEKYLGLGPSAHSFNGKSRRWNVSSLPKYCQAIQLGRIDAEQEEETFSIRYNDFVMTGLRTIWGIDLERLESEFGIKMLDYCLKNARKHLQSGLLLNANGKLTFSEKGIFVSDGVMSDLMCVE